MALVLGATVVLYWAPNTNLRVAWTLPGALLFAVAWSVGTYAFSIFLANFGAYNATYGSLGAAAILLVWFYLTSFILLVGAELNAVLDKHRDRATAASQPCDWRSGTEEPGRRRSPVRDATMHLRCSVPAAIVGIGAGLLLGGLLRHRAGDS